MARHAVPGVSDIKLGPNGKVEKVVFVEQKATSDASSSSR